MKKKTAHLTTKDDDNSGVIRADEAYTLEAVRRRLGLTESAWRKLHDMGLPYKQIGKRKYILGKAIIAFLERLPDFPSDKARVQPTINTDYEESLKLLRERHGMK